MALMIDRMLRPGTKFYPSDGMQESFGADIAEEIFRKLVPVFKIAPVFNIDNVAEYYAATYEHGAMPIDDFVNAAPVSRTFWMEALHNEGISEDGRPVARTAHDPDYRFGLLFTATDLETSAPDEIRWHLDSYLFTARSDYPHQINGPMFVSKFYVRGDGSIADGELIGGTDADGQPNRCESYIEATYGMESIFQIAFLALTFLHCKNVTTTEHSGRYANRQERREAQRRGDPERVAFHTLQIEPMKKVLATEGGIGHNGLKKALHICRGHFSEYGEEYGKGKLFGKLEGRYFVPAHVRGSSDSGVALKDYNVKAPRPENM